MVRILRSNKHAPDVSSDAPRRSARLQNRTPRVSAITQRRPRKEKHPASSVTSARPVLHLDTEMAAENPIPISSPIITNHHPVGVVCPVCFHCEETMSPILSDFASRIADLASGPLTLLRMPGTGLQVATWRANSSTLSAFSDPPYNVDHAEYVNPNRLHHLTDMTTFGGKIHYIAFAVPCSGFDPHHLCTTDDMAQKFTHVVRILKADQVQDDELEPRRRNLTPPDAAPVYERTYDQIKVLTVVAPNEKLEDIDQFKVVRNFLSSIDVVSSSVLVLAPLYYGTPPTPLELIASPTSGSDETYSHSNILPPAPHNPNIVQTVNAFSVALLSVHIFPHPSAATLRSLLQKSFSRLTSTDIIASYSDEILSAVPFQLLLESMATDV